MPCYYSHFMLKKYLFCKKSVHSFLGLGLSNAMDSPLPPPLFKCGLGLINNETPRVVNPNVIESSSSLLLNLKPMTPASSSSSTPSPPPSDWKKKDPDGIGFIDETPRVVNPNVIESSSSLLLNVKPMTPTSSPPSPPPLSPKKKDPGGIGFIDEMGGGVDGLMSCTESLGFESCDERRVDDDHRDMEFGEGGERDRWRRKRRIEEKRTSGRNNNKFPPPLSYSLNQNGEPCFYLKPVRKNGRLELTKVKIQQRPEILRAVRENGRLRLHLVNVSSKIKQEEEEEKEKKVEELWKYRVSGEGFRRCHELVMSHHHHHHVNDHHRLHVWRQPCVTTR